MLDHKSVADSLGTQLGALPARRLVERYRDVHGRFLTRQWEECLTQTGKFVEAVIRCLICHVFGETHETVAVAQEIDRLSNLPKDGYDAETRIHIPRVCRALYDLRSNWGGGHDSLQVSPIAMDAQFAYTGVKWLMLELMRRFSCMDRDDLQALVDAFHPTSFVIQEIDDSLVFLDNRLTIREAITVVAAHWFPRRVKLNEFVSSIPWRVSGSIRHELRNMEQDGYLHKNPEGYLATGKALTESLSIHQRYCQDF